MNCGYLYHLQRLGLAVLIAGAMFALIAAVIWLAEVLTGPVFFMAVSFCLVVLFIYLLLTWSFE